MTNSFKIDLGNGLFLSVEKYNDGEHGDEATVYISDEHDTLFQDIVLVRKHAEKNGEQVGNKVDVMVFADEEDDDYTNKHVVKVRDAE